VLPLRSAVSPSRQPSAEQIERVGFLRSEIQRHDQLYHRDASPEITDAEYDELKRELLTLTGQFRDRVVGQDYPSNAIATNDRIPGFTSHPHGERMLSLEKAYSEMDVRKFHARVTRRLGKSPTCVVEPKFDGVAVSAIYEHGELIHVLTRGDGSSGDDITSNAIRYTDIPAKLIRPASFKERFPERMEIRGEVFMSLPEFEQVNLAREAAGDATYASPRNLAAGTLKLLNEEAGPERRLQVVFYGLGAIVPAIDDVTSQHELVVRLKTWGLPTPDHVRIAGTVDALWSIVREMGTARARWSFPSDGLVVKVDSRADQRTLGANDQAPQWAIAFKFTAERQTTRLRAITLQVGRTGLITPVAELEPVQLGGAIIRRATLHNADEIARRDLRVGDYVVVERGGEIIPAIVGVDLLRRGESTLPFVFPKDCPGCAESLVRRDGQVAWRCVNLRCRAQIKRRVRHFASVGCVGIPGLGEATVEKLVESGKVENVSDLYALRREDLLSVTGAASSDGLLAAIARSRNVELWRIIHGLGIEGVGSRTAKILAAEYVSFDRFAAADIEQFRNVDGVNAEAAENLARYCASSEVKRLQRAFGPTDSQVRAE
jgi:DNA ligase (NAD+)